MIRVDRREEMPEGEGSTVGRREGRARSLELIANLARVFWDDVADRISVLGKTLIEEFLEARRAEVLGTAPTSAPPRATGTGADPTRYERKLRMRDPVMGVGVPSGRSVIGAAGAVTPARGGTPMLRVVPKDDARQAFALTPDEICRRGAERMVAIALEAEVEAYLERHRDARNDRGHAPVVRNGHARPRTVVSGAGAIGVKAPPVHDRRIDEGG